MKKILSLVLVICMILGTVSLLSSCGSKVSVKDFEENPAQALSIVTTKTSFLANDEVNVVKNIITDSLNGGSVEVVFESNSLMGSDITSIGEKIYLQAGTKELVSDTVIKYKGEDLAARLFVDKSGVILDSQSLLGNNKPMKVDMATLASGFTDSALAKLMGMPADQADDVDDYLELVKSVYEKMFSMFDDIKSQQNDYVNKLYNAVNATATEATVVVDGEEYDCVVITLNLNNKTIETYIKLVAELYMDYIKKMYDFEGAEILNIGGFDLDSFIEEYNEEIEYMIEEMNEEYVIDIKIEMNIDTASAAVVSQTVKGTVSEDDAETVMNVNGNIIYGNDKLSGDVSVICDDAYGKETNSFDYTVKNNSDGDNAIYKIDVNYKVDSEWEKAEHKIVDLTYTHNKASSEFTLDGKLGFDDEENYVALKGTLKIGGNSFTLVITSVTLDAFTVNFKLTLTVNKEDTVPQRPADALDVVTMTEGNWVDLVNQIQSSQLVKIFGELT